MVTGAISLPSFDWSYCFNPDGTYRVVAASCGGMKDGIVIQTGKYQLIGNTIIYYDEIETLYEGTPLMLIYEERHMGDRINLEFIDDYNQEEDKIMLGLTWYHRIKD